MKRTILILAVCAFIGSSKLSAQVVTPIYDKSKHYQLRSMETGPWDFHPAWWYYWFHRQYSGAKSHWRWRGFKSGWVVDFNEGRYAPNSRLRASMLLTAKLSKKEYESITKQVSNVHKRELANIADRSVDIVQTDYKQIFNKLEILIVKYIVEYRNEIGSDELLKEFITEHQKIKESIEMMHTSYVTNIDRQRVYLEQLKKLEELIMKCRSCLETNHMFNVLDQYKQDARIL